MSPPGAMYDQLAKEYDGKDLTEIVRLCRADRPGAQCNGPLQPPVDGGVKRAVRSSVPVLLADSSALLTDSTGRTIDEAESDFGYPACLPAGEWPSMTLIAASGKRLPVSYNLHVISSAFPELFKGKGSVLSVSTREVEAQSLPPPP